MKRHNKKPRSSQNVSYGTYHALSEFRYSVRRFLRVTEENARNAGMHPQQHRLLLAVKGMPAGLAPSIGNLAARMQVEHHSAVELVDRAVRSGLVTRQHQTRDRRVVLVSVTSRGEQLLRKISLQNREELRSLAPALVKTLRALTLQRQGRSHTVKS